MAVPSSGELGLLGLAREKLLDDYDSVYLPPVDLNLHPYPYDIFTWITTASNADLSRGTISSPVVHPSDSAATPLEMEVTGNSAYTYTYNSSTWNIGVAANGESWTVSCYVKASANCTCNLFLFFARANSTIISGQYGAVYMNVTTSWQRFEATRLASSSDVAFFQVRLGGPSSHASETIWWDGLQVERNATFATAYTGPITLLDLAVSGDDGGSANDYEGMNAGGQNSGLPTIYVPHGMNEWYSYDHDFQSPATAQILLHSNGSDPGSADTYSFYGEGFQASAVYRVVIANISGNTAIIGNDLDFSLAAEGPDTTPDNYTTSTNGFSISSTYSTFYFKVARILPGSPTSGTDTVRITVTPAGSGVTTDYIDITFQWDFFGEE
jgi:hypothetical protein